MIIVRNSLTLLYGLALPYFTDLPYHTVRTSITLLYGLVLLLYGLALLYCTD